MTVSVWLCLCDVSLCWVVELVRGFHNTRKHMLSSRSCEGFHVPRNLNAQKRFNNSMSLHQIADYPPSFSDTGASQPDSGEKPQAQELPAFFHLESTNFVVKSTVGVLSLSMLQDAIEETLEQTNVDIVDFVPCDSMVSH